MILVFTEDTFCGGTSVSWLERNIQSIENGYVGGKEMKLNESDKKIADDVVSAYNTSENGSTKRWASNQALSIIAFQRNEREFVPSIHALIKSVICTMVKVGKLKVVK